MKIKYSFICEAANISDSGNLNVLGIFRNITVNSFPASFTKMVYVACIEFHRSEAGKHQFKLSFVDDDGKAVLPPLQGEIAAHELNPYASIMLGLDNIQFPHPGQYSIDLTVDNRHISTDTVKVFKAPENNAQNTSLS